MIIVKAAPYIEIRRDNVWLYTFAIIVGLGKPVLSRNNWTLPRPDKSKDIVRHQPAVRDPRVLVCSPLFQLRYPNAYKMLKHCAEAKDSKWVLRDQFSEVAGARVKKKRKPVHFKNNEDVFRFLHQVRRVVRTRSFGGTFAKRS